MKAENRRCFNEMKHEEDFAIETGMDSIYWCHACKYGDCERH